MIQKEMHGSFPVAAINWLKEQIHFEQLIFSAEVGHRVAQVVHKINVEIDATFFEALHQIVETI